MKRKIAPKLVFRFEAQEKKLNKLQRKVSNIPIEIERFVICKYRYNLLYHFDVL